MASSRTPLIAGNWKMNGLSADGTALASELASRMKSAKNGGFEMLVCPPFTLISKVGAAIEGSGLQLGGQDCHSQVKGAHTGDTSAAMLADLGCHYVIVGHSERRTDHGERNEQVRAKAAAGHAAGLNVIICIGETEAERDAGKALEVNKSQVAGSLPDGATAANTVIAYEPVWAIGTGRTPTTDEVQEVHAFIRSELAARVGAEADGMRILYGGSMKPGNAAELIALPDVDGGLIGGASLQADDFWAIAQTCL
ncbi:MAG: triose-phosphate isomerase [Rhodospirillales bacterium]|nr:triose-phosphate isomerase [Rhodospirillales bacterium]